MAKTNTRELCVEILENVRRNAGYVDELLESAFDERNLSQSDKRLVHEIVNGTLRWRGQLDWLLSHLLNGELKKTPTRLKSILQIGLYQIKFLDKIPSYAAVSESVEVAKEFGGNGWGKLVNGVLRTYLRSGTDINFPSLEDNPAMAISVHYSHPRWMIERWIEQFGKDETIELCKYNNRRPGVTLRVNLERTTKKELIDNLKKNGIDFKDATTFDDFIRLDRPGDLTNLPMFQDGGFAIQDESTAIASLLLQPEKGDIVLDMCAAPGGKTCHIAQLQGDRGKVIAVDINANRLQRLQQNKQRLNLKSILPIIGNGSNIFLSRVDKILIDAPCSGLGVLSKRADLRWRRTVSDIRNIGRTQLALLTNAGKLLKKGGVLVYSTCSFEKEETDEMITQFLKENGSFQIDKPKDSKLKQFLTDTGFLKALPFKHNMDGVFAVRLVKAV